MERTGAGPLLWGGPVWGWVSCGGRWAPAAGLRLGCGGKGPTAGQGHCRGPEAFLWGRGRPALGRSLAAGSDPVLGEVGSCLRERSVSVCLSLCWGRFPLIPYI